MASSLRCRSDARQIRVERIVLVASLRRVPRGNERSMKVQAPFGFVTGCHAGDTFMVQATLASMKHFCPEVPICLVVDGSFDVSDLESEYGLIVLRVSQLPSNKMREAYERECPRQTRRDVGRTF